MPIEYTFGASVDRVFERLSNPDFLVDRCLALGEISAECSVEDDGKQVVIALTREVERSLPSFLSRLFESRQTIEQVERWKQSKGNIRHGSMLIKVIGQPVTIEAEMRLKPGSSSGCSYVIAHTVKANMPLIGRRVETFMLTQIETGARAELDYLVKALQS